MTRAIQPREQRFGFGIESFEGRQDRRPMIQFVLGIGAGTLLIAVAILALRGRQDGRIVGETGLSIEHVGLLALHATIMLGVCLLACIVPTRRALRVEPTEALRTD